MDEELLLEIAGKDSLHWSYRLNEELPQELQTATDLEDLYLKHNRLKKLPKWIGKLANLSILQLHGNLLEELPEEIGLITNLYKLDLGCNRLQALPTTIKNLRRLQDLNLENNTLTNLPDEIGLLPALYYLTLSNNKLNTLPLTLGCCSSLQELYLQNNNIMCIPNNIVFLPNLNVVRFENNKLIYFPAILFYGNPLINFSNNLPLNYISYDFYSYLNDIGTHRMNSMFLKNYNSINCGEIERNSEYDHLLNVMIEIKYRGKRTVLILPDTVQHIYTDKSNANYIPTLYETLLRRIYKETGKENNTLYFYKMNDNYIPKQIKEVFIKGPTAKCHNCKNFIFKECIIWVVPKILHCSICLENDIITVVYFCSSKCVNNFRIEEDTYDDWLHDKLSSILLKWTKIQ